jgi:hypothetical protein
MHWYLVCLKRFDHLNRALVPTLPIVIFHLPKVVEEVLFSRIDLRIHRVLAGASEFEFELLYCLST